jgi:threonine 3-dehydrogenase
MLAVCKVEPGEDGIEICRREPRDPGPGEIRLKVAAAGICGTDMQIYHWAPRMARRMALPRTLGHEVSGTVDAVGPGVEAPAVGDRVALESHIYCGVCRPCRLGKAHLCTDTAYPGIDIDGAFAEYVTVPARIAWEIPSAMGFETAAMMEPFGIAVHAALAGGGVAGRSVLVNGCGPIGLMCVAACRALGALTVIACDMNGLRLKTAGEMGADLCVDAKLHSAAEAAMQTPRSTRWPRAGTSGWSARRRRRSRWISRAGCSNARKCRTSTAAASGTPGSGQASWWPETRSTSAPSAATSCRSPTRSAASR